MTDLRINTDQHRYEMDVDGETVFANYHVQNGICHILHVEAPPVLRGTGAAGKLMALVAADIRAQGWKANPVCGYAATWLKRSKDFRDLVA